MSVPGLSALAAIDRRRVVHAVGLLLLLAVVGVFVASAVPQAVGADESYVVLTNSMSPSIDAGAVVFVSAAPTDEIERGDVITFRRGDGADRTTTHRVVGVQHRNGERQFVTRGDANEDPDPNSIPASAVVGVVAFHVPLIGYVVSFANTRLGVLAFVVLPALLLVVLELRELWHATDDADDRGGIL